MECYGDDEETSMILKNKEGSLQDLIILIVVLFTLAISLIIGKVVFSSINDSGIFEGSPTAEHIASQMEDNVYPAFDVMFFITFIAGVLGAGLLAFAIRTHPAFYWVSFIFLTIVTLVSATLSNVWQTLMENATLNQHLATSEITGYVMTNLPFFIVGSGFIIMLIMYALNQTDGI